MTLAALDTDRLILRTWRDDDLAPFAALNADPEVMAHVPEPLAPAASDAMAARIRDGLARDGYGLWAVEVKGGPAFIGFVGVKVPTNLVAPFLPAHELGWRLARAAWGHGYAIEAAHACARFAFASLQLAELVAFTVPANTRSRAVMARLGMTHDPVDDFDHSALAVGHPLRRHVLYRLARVAYGGRASGRM